MFIHYIDLNDLNSSQQELVNKYANLLIVNRFNKFTGKLDPRIPEDVQKILLTEVICIVTGKDKNEIWTKMGYNENVIIVRDTSFLFFPDPSLRYIDPVSPIKNISDGNIDNIPLPKVQIHRPLAHRPLALHTQEPLPLALHTQQPLLELKLDTSLPLRQAPQENFLVFFVIGIVMIVILLIFRG